MELVAFFSLVKTGAHKDQTKPAAQGWSLPVLLSIFVECLVLPKPPLSWTTRALGSALTTDHVVSGLYGVGKSK